MVWSFFFKFSKVSNQIKYEYFMYTKSTNFTKYIQYLPYCFWKLHIRSKMLQYALFTYGYGPDFLKICFYCHNNPNKTKQIRIIFSGHVVYNIAMFLRTVLSCLESVCLCWRCFKRYFSHHLNKTNINKLIQDNRKLFV